MMRGFWAALAACVVLAFGVAAPGLAAAQGVVAATSTEQQVRSYGAWSERLQGIIVGLVGVLNGIPQPPVEGADRATRRDWATVTRTWTMQAHQSLASLQAEAAQIPPPPNAPAAPQQLRVAMDETRQQLPGLLASVDHIVTSYAQLATAYESGDDSVMWQMRVEVIDGSLLTLQLFQRINIGQAGALSASHPQRSYLLSISSSYDALSAVLQFKRGIIATRSIDPAQLQQAAARVDSEAAEMRGLIASGLAARRLMSTQFSSPGAVAPSEEGLAARIRSALLTYDASFEREALIADKFQRIAVLLRDPRDYSLVEPGIDRIVEELGGLDLQRMEDAQRRQAIMTAP